MFESSGFCVTLAILSSRKHSRLKHKSNRDLVRSSPLE